MSQERKLMMYKEVEEALGSALVGATPQTLAALACVYEPSTVCLADTEVGRFVVTLSD